MRPTLMMLHSHMLRWLTACAVLLQLALPFAQAEAADRGVDLATLICSPSGQTASTEAKTAMSDLLSLLGEPEPTQIDAECERCITPNLGLISGMASGLEPVTYARLVSERPRKDAQGPIAPRGPPCGTRAPPRFV